MRRLGEIRGHIIRMFASRSMEKDESPGGIFQFPNGNELVPGGICNSQTETGWSPGGFAIPKRKWVSPQGIFQFPNGNGLVPGGICNSQTETH